MGIRKYGTIHVLTEFSEVCDTYRTNYIRKLTELDATYTWAVLAWALFSRYDFFIHQYRRTYNEFSTRQYAIDSK